MRANYISPKKFDLNAKVRTATLETGNFRHGTKLHNDYWTTILQENIMTINSNIFNIFNNRVL